MITNFFKIDYRDFFDNVDPYRAILIILVTTLIAFSPIFMGSEFLGYDDNWYIYENEYVVNLSWDSIIKIFSRVKGGQYSPLGEVYHSILYYFFGKNATAFKIMALIVHLLNVRLLFEIFKNIFNDKLLIYFVVLFFAIHPIQVEVIGWLSVIYRNAVFLMFLGYYFYLKYLDKSFNKLYLLPVFVCYLLACLTKEQAILFPVGLVLINMVKYNYEFNKRIIVEVFIWVLLTVIFALITVQITKTGGPSIVGRDTSLFEKMSLFSKALFDYTFNFLMPIKLSLFYPFPKGKISMAFLRVMIAVVFLGISFYVSYKNKIFRFGFLWFFGFLSIALSFSFLYLRDTLIADRYMYLAIIGSVIMLYAIIEGIEKKIRFKGFSIIFIAVYALACFVLTFKRIALFNKSKNLWTNAIEIDPRNQFAYNTLANIYSRKKDFKKASEYFKKSIEVDSTYFLPHYNIAYIYAKNKQIDSALYHVTKSISLKHNFKKSYELRASISKGLKIDDLYLSDLNKLIGIDAEDIVHRLDRAKFLIDREEYQFALQDIEVILKLDSNNINGNYYSGLCNYNLKKYTLSEAFITKSINLNNTKGSYYYLRSLTRRKVNNVKGALTDALKAKELGHKFHDEYISLLVSEYKKVNALKNE